MRLPGKPKKKAPGKKVPGLVERGLARKRFGPFGKLVRVKPKPVKEKPATLKELRKGANEMERLAAEAGKHGSAMESLAEMNRHLAKVKEKIRADRQTIKGAKAKRDEIKQKARDARKNLPPKQANAKVGKLTVQLNGLRARVLRARSRLEIYRGREQVLIKKLRALSQENRARAKRLGLNE